MGNSIQQQLGQKQLPRSCCQFDALLRLIRCSNVPMFQEAVYTSKMRLIIANWSDLFNLSRISQRADDGLYEYYNLKHSRFVDDIIDRSLRNMKLSIFWTSFLVIQSIDGFASDACKVYHIRIRKYQT